jgi:transcriptional regulator with GAF, ATPase, and Fis domain
LAIHCWRHKFGAVAGLDEAAFDEALLRKGVIGKAVGVHGSNDPGLCLGPARAQDLSALLQQRWRDEESKVIAVTGAATGPEAGWDLLAAGASDVLTATQPELLAEQIAARLQRWQDIDALVAECVRDHDVVAHAPCWRRALRGVVEAARFSDASVLILGETGAGKEIAAHLVHRLDARPRKGELVILDCSTLQPELSGSEFFGHERGAFTGAIGERQGAFALADGGTLFLDEVGELSPPMQAQLLRVIQERAYKRVGGSVWRRSAFRLVCATNRNLLDLVERGAFRADLYYRIAGFVCRLPALRERLDDIVPLAEHFLRATFAGAEAPRLGPALCDWLLRRDYPGNIRELRQLLSRLALRYCGGGEITIGQVPPEDRSLCAGDDQWADESFACAVRRAVLLGAGLKDIGRMAEDLAIRIATEAEGGNLQRAARRLGVTDRALQLRRAGKTEPRDSPKSDARAAH